MADAGAVVPRLNLESDEIQELKKIWSRCYDYSSGYDYFYNEASGEALWETPPGLEGVELPYHPDFMPATAQQSEIHARKSSVVSSIAPPATPRPEHILRKPKGTASAQQSVKQSV